MAKNSFIHCAERCTVRNVALKPYKWGSVQMRFLPSVIFIYLIIVHIIWTNRATAKCKQMKMVKCKDAAALICMCSFLFLFLFFVSLMWLFGAYTRWWWRRKRYFFPFVSAVNLIVSFIENKWKALWNQMIINMHYNKVDPFLPFGFFSLCFGTTGRVVSQFHPKWKERKKKERAREHTQNECVNRC